ncbi:acetyl-CoA C-acyltransferase [bacterium]|nr:acetyl-CoA C-acyltransferase [bacterium]
MSEVVFVGGKRTPFGEYLGDLSRVPANDLGTHAAKAALADGGIDPNQIDHAVIGMVGSTDSDAYYCARHVALNAGVPIDVPALTVNRLCGSGAEAIVQGAYLLDRGDAETVLVGGTESMSRAFHYTHGIRQGKKWGNLELRDFLWDSLTDGYCKLPMAITAENLAEDHDISRKDCEEFAVLTQDRYADALGAGHFVDEIAPIEVGKGRRAKVVDRDSCPKPGTTVEKISGLRAVFKEGGVVTAATASGVVDGACALVMTTATIAKERGWDVMGRLKAWGHAGVAPDRMGYGPVPSSETALAKAGLSVADIHRTEINEAFVAQYIAVERGLGLDREKTNSWGGATAIGHPLGATGARLALTCLRQLRLLDGGGLGLVSMCIGGGQGITLILEVDG